MRIPTPADLAARHPRRPGADVRPPSPNPSPSPSPTVTRRDGTCADVVQVLAAVADLLEPCDPPDVANGWMLCAHAEQWPCAVTRAAWLARGVAPARATVAPARVIGEEQ